MASYLSDSDKRNRRSEPPEWSADKWVFTPVGDGCDLSKETADGERTWYGAFPSLEYAKTIARQLDGYVPEDYGLHEVTIGEWRARDMGGECIEILKSDTNQLTCLMVVREVNPPYPIPDCPFTIENLVIVLKKWITDRSGTDAHAGTNRNTHGGK